MIIVALCALVWIQLSSCALPGPQIGMPRYIGLEAAHQQGGFDRDIGRLGVCIWQFIVAPSNNEPLSNLDKHCLAAFGQGYEDDRPPAPRDEADVADNRNRLIQAIRTADRAMQELERFWQFFLSIEGLRLWGEIFAQMRQGDLFERDDHEEQDDREE